MNGGTDKVPQSVQLANGDNVIGDIRDDDIDVMQEKAYRGGMDKITSEKWWYLCKTY